MPQQFIVEHCHSRNRKTICASCNDSYKEANKQNRFASRPISWMVTQRRYYVCMYVFYVCLFNLLLFVFCIITFELVTWGDGSRNKRLQYDAQHDSVCGSSFLPKCIFPHCDERQTFKQAYYWCCSFLLKIFDRHKTITCISIKCPKRW